MYYVDLPYIFIQLTSSGNSDLFHRMAIEGKDERDLYWLQQEDNDRYFFTNIIKTDLCWANLKK